MKEIIYFNSTRHPPSHLELMIKAVRTEGGEGRYIRGEGEGKKEKRGIRAARKSRECRIIQLVEMKREGERDRLSFFFSLFFFFARARHCSSGRASTKVYIRAI